MWCYVSLKSVIIHYIKSDINYYIKSKSPYIKKKNRHLQHFPLGKCLGWRMVYSFTKAFVLSEPPNKASVKLFYLVFATIYGVILFGNFFTKFGEETCSNGS